jgi:hypothetical protein
MIQRRSWITLLATVAIVGAFAMAGCDGDPDTGRVHLVLTDAPYPVDMMESAQVTIEAISVHVAGDESGWHDLPFTEDSYDLLDLQNGVTAELIDAELPVGSLNETMLDMDVSRSFLPIPSSPTKVEEIRSFSFKLVVRVTNLTTTGSVFGYVLSDLGTGTWWKTSPSSRLRS